MVIIIFVAMALMEVKKLPRSAKLHSLHSLHATSKLPHEQYDVQQKVYITCISFFCPMN